MRSAVVIVEAEEIRLFALEADEMGRFAGPAFDADRDATLTMLLYRETIAGLDLGGGQLTLEAELPSRELPRADAIFEKSGEEGGWELLSDLPERLGKITVRATTRDDCLASGGCYADRSRAEQLWCARPCPASVELEPTLEVVPPAEPSLSWSPADRVACSGAEAQWVDAPGCAPIDPCPAGPFAEQLGGDVVYVDPSAPPGGDGTLSMPFRTVAEAEPFSPGAAIALSRGSHAGLVQLRDNALIGACARDTIVEDLIDVGGSASIEGATLLGTVTAQNAALEIREALITGSIYAFESTVHTQRVVVRSATRAAAISDGGMLFVRDSVIEGGVIARSGLVSISGSVIAAGSQTGVASDQRLELARTLFDGNGFYSVDATGEISIDEAVVRNGGGITVNTASGAIDRLLIERTRERGIDIFYSTLRIDDLVVRDVIPFQPLLVAPGMRAIGSNLRVARARIERTQGRALEVSGGTFSLGDLVISEVGEADQSASANQGFGVVGFGAVIDAARIEVAGVHTTGIYVEQGEAALTDVFVHGSREGNGIGVRDVAPFRIDRAILEENDEAGLQIEGTTTARIDSVWSSYANSGATFGDGAVVIATNLHITDTRSLGICVRDQVDVTLSGVEVVRTLAQESTACTITNPPPGSGIVMNGQPKLTMSSFRLEGNQTNGLLINRDATTTIFDGEIKGSFVGAQLDPEVDPASVMVRVLFQDNVTDVEVY